MTHTRWREQARLMCDRQHAAMSACESCAALERRLMPVTEVLADVLHDADLKLEFRWEGYMSSRKYRVRKDMFRTATGAQWSMWFVHFPAFMHREPLSFWYWDSAINFATWDAHHGGR